MFLLLIALARANGPTTLEPAPPNDLGPAPVVDLLTEARRRLLRGDYPGVRLLAEEVLAMEDHRDARYLQALSWEKDGNPALALDLYEALLADAPEDADVLFRRAETLGLLGRYREALVALDTLGDDWEGGDRLQIDLLRALFDLEDGGSRRKPLAALRDALDRATPEEAPGYQARARARLVAMAIDDAHRIPFTGSKSKKAKYLELRAGLLELAKEQTVAVIHLDAAEHVLDSLLWLGDGYADFGQAMLDESEVKRLTDAQRDLYEAERARRVETLWIKAARTWESALDYAGRVGWEETPVPEILRKRDDIQTRIEKLPVE